MERTLVILIGLAACHADPVKFSLPVTERGTQFVETVTVDAASGTERYDVPAHNDVLAATYVIDYNRNLTVRLVPERGRCVVSDLDPVSRESGSLATHQAAFSMQQEVSGDSRVRTVEYVWRLEPTPLSLVQRAALPPAARRMCAHTPITRMTRVSDPHHPHPHTRVRRQDPGPESTCPYTDKKQRCKVGWNNCRYVAVATCDSIWENRERRHRADCVNPTTLHIYDRVICCVGCCGDRQLADPTFPYCEEITRQDIPGVC